VIVLDANVLIAVLTPADAHHRAGRELLARAVADAEDLLVTPVTLGEALMFPARQGRARVAEQAAALAELGVTEVPFPPGAAADLAMLRSTGLKMPDCCVLLTAMDREAALASFDDQLRRAALIHGVRPAFG
jgi:predicted nucleic acid-binding protein